MKRKILALFLALTLIFSTSATAVTAFAATGPAITLEKKDAYVGDNVSIVVSIENNPGLWGMDLRISYDKSAMTLTSVDNGTFFQSSEWTKGNLSADVYTLSYEAGDLADITTASGTLATLNFTIKDDATPGTYAVNASYNSGDIINISFADVDFTITNGSITVANKPVPVTGVSLDKTTATVKTGNTVTLTPVFAPDTATNKNVTWSSSNEEVATVVNGVVTGVKEGTASITVKTEDGNFEASCAVTVECGHNTTHNVSAVSSTCKEQGHGAYTVCDECGRIISGSDEKLPLGGHSYTEKVHSDYLASVATCNKKAVYYKSCSVCGEKSNETFEYGEFDPANHVGSTYKVGQKEATCYEEGYTGDVYCSDCNVKLSSGTTINKTAHNPASTWSTDANYHWHECQTVGCGNLIDKAAHTGGEATCKNKAICSVCGVEYGSLNPNNHKNTEIRDAKEATCCEDGYTGDTYCKDCGEKIATGSVINATGNHTDADGKWETDGTSHWHTCYYGTKFDVTAHAGGTATCKDKAICSVCGTEYGEKDADNHTGGTEVRDAQTASCNTNGYTGDTYCKGCGEKIASGSVIKATGDHVDADGKWECDGTQHYHTCSCGTKFDYSNHTGGTATCKDKAKCSICGAEYGELNESNHTGNTEIKNANEAKCNAEGYTGDTYCKDCGKKLESGHSIEKISHNISGWTVTKEATVSECGEKIGKCISCGEDFKTETAKLSSKPIEEKNTEYEGMKSAPKLVPSGDTVLPENAVFVAEKKNTDNLTTEEKAEVDKALKELESNIVSYVGEGKKAEKVDVLCVFNFDLLLRNTDKQTGDSLGDEEYHFDGSVNVTVEMPEAMKTAKNPCIVHLKDDGTCEAVAFTKNSDGTISFTVTGFSSFVLLDVETSAVTEKDDDPTTPETGDDSMMTLWIIMFVASTVGLVITSRGRKKKAR